MIKKIVQLIGPFEFKDEVFEESLQKREAKPRKTQSNGDYYEGEWIAGSSIKEGRGKFFDF